MNRPTKDDTERLERSIRGIHFSLVRLTRPLLSTYGLTPPRFHLLLALERSGPARMGEIHRQLHTGASTATTLADGLESEGFLERYRTNADRRVVFLRITKKGEECITKIRVHRQQILRESLGRVPDETRIAITNQLEKVNDTLSSLSSMSSNSGACS